MKLHLFSLATILSLVSFSTHATPILSSFTQPAVYFSQDHSLGYAFSSDTDTTVTALGFFDSNSDGLSADHEVGLWDASGSLLGLVDLSAGTGESLIDEFRYGFLSTGVNLLAGLTYYLAGTTNADDWVYQASDIVMDTGINYLGSYYTPNVGGSAKFPPILAPSREYMTVNALTAVRIPEPETILMFTLGLLGLKLSRRSIVKK
ncbi:hypothetical protein A9Q99_13080 [Gammaproteobacteria bacterium 45_16_T64]|nr:hypothetical protein A9Q99_13080 [Gammaproteobacteria bacterium 45_16_T64]